MLAEHGLAAARLPAGSEDGEELVEVTLDLEDDDTIVLWSVRPDGAVLGSLRLPTVQPGEIADGGALSSSSRSLSIRWTSWYGLM
jgi:respiratory burst oxidase